MAVKLTKFNFGFFKYKSFNKYLLNDLYLKKPKLNLVNFTAITNFRNTSNFEKTLLIGILNIRSFKLFKIFNKNFLVFIKNLHQSILPRLNFLNNSIESDAKKSFIFQRNRFLIKHLVQIFYCVF